MVPNGSFEDHSNCPFLQDQVTYCNFWQEANGCTADYVCTCSPSGNGVNSPFYWMGYQEAFHGSCYMGIGAYGDMEDGIDLLLTESIQTELTDSLLAFHKYRISLFVSLCNSSEFTIDNFGVLVSETRPNKPFECDTFSAYHPQLVVSYLTDTMNWVKQEAEFVAQGGEKWLTISRFDFNGPSQLAAVSTNTPVPFLNYAYYLVDSVTLIDITDLENLPDFQNVISPNNDGINDVFILPEYEFLFQENVVIYSRWGNEVAVLNSNNPFWPENTFTDQNVHSGTYFYVFSASTKEGKIIYKKGTLSVFR